jgi:hypothetical protein
VGVLLLLVLLAAGVTVAGAASPLLGANLRVSGGAAITDEYLAAVAWSDKAEEYLVVWVDGRNASAGRGRDIYGQRVSADGVRVGQDFRVSGGGATSDEDYPAVAWSASAGGYLVVWSDGRSAATRGDDIYGQLVETNGVRVGANFRISDGATVSDEWYPALVSNPAANEYLVVWADWRSFSARGADIYGQRLGGNGALVGGNFPISGPNATAQENTPAVAWSQAAGGYLVVWQDTRNSSARGQDIYGQRLAANGSRIGRDFRISGPNATSHEGNPAVAWSPADDGYLVVWQDHRNGSTRGYDIYGQRLGGDGVPIGSNLRISGSAATDYDTAPAVAWSPSDGGYLVVWEDERNEATRGRDIYGRRLNADGTPSGGDFRISGAAATSDEGWTAAVSDQTGKECLVVWADQRNEATRGWDIYGQRVAG